MSEPGKSKVVKWVWAASAVGTLCTSWEALHHSINALHVHLNTYNLEVWSILHEQDTWVELVKELEEVLAVEELTDEEAEMRQEKVWYDAKRSQVARLKVVTEGEEE